MIKKALISTAGILFVSTSFAAECGKITIAEMNWNSASLMANVDQFILANGYDCNAELVPGDTMPTGTSMIEKGQPDIAPELWTNSMKAALTKGVDEGRLKIAVKSLSDGGEEAFWVPKYMVDEMPELATIEGIRQHADQFEHPEDPSKSAFYGCPAGWNCQITARNLFNALKLDESNFELIDPGSGAGLSGSIARAYERQQPWFGYYWAPTAILGKYEMVKVDFGSGIDEQHYIDCISMDDCLEPKATMYPPSPVYTVTTTEFAERAPNAYAYLSNRSFTNVQMNNLLAWMEDNQADGKYAAENFMFEHEDIWSKWVSEDVKVKLNKALDNL
ncbi:ABC transporter substrate-binding protein [Marinomonas gallaica]|uniref:ABC transporter substrate-binding protein n=1 Tax=Marinomonas gallaica TaxID=1806667 RepID=UPI000836469C|nr:ABC transporter substrate-binding protein [Marinomonas gallaica]